MPPISGKDLLLKISDEATQSVFTTVAGLRTRSISLNAQPIDVTHSESVGGWRELIAGGVRQASVSGAGIFLNDAAAGEIRSVFFAGSVRKWRIVIPGFGFIEGAFLVSNLDYSGDYDGEGAYAIALESAGVLTFTAEAS
ncbi:MAG: phage major tail protein, TP901-1 family [Pseudomonadota bacterium]